MSQMPFCEIKFGMSETDVDRRGAAKKRKVTKRKARTKTSIRFSRLTRFAG